MSWTKIDNDTLERSAIVAVPRYARLVHIEAVLWCGRQLSDGAIPRHMLGYLTHEPSAAEAVDELVKGGLWETTKTGWQIVGYVDEYTDAATVMETRKQDAERQRRTRDRSKKHGNGDHSLCDSRWCKSKDSAATKPAAATTNGVAPMPRVTVIDGSKRGAS